MAAVTTLPHTSPLQELPTYMTWSTFTITTGTPATAIITEVAQYKPQTYYGPSIPLGDDGVWTWGGLTSPTAVPTTSTTSTRPAGTTMTSSTTSSSSTSSTPLPPSTGATPTISSPTATGSPGSTTTAAPGSSQGESNISDRVLLIIILVITLFFLLVSGVAVYAWLKRRRQARVTSSGTDNASGIRHRGVTFRRVLPGIIFNSLYRGSSHRHSRLPQDEEAVPPVPPVPTTRQRGHANDSGWDFTSPSDRGSSPSVRMVPGTGPGAGVTYRSILPFDEDDDVHHPSSASSSQNRFADLPRPREDTTVDTGGGHSSSDRSTPRSLFFLNPALQHGDLVDRDPRLFPDSYARGDSSRPRYDSLPPPPRSRNLPPPIDEELLLPPLLVDQPPLTPRRHARASTPMPYPGTPGDDHDEEALLLQRSVPRSQRPEPPGTGTAAGGLVSRLSMLLKRISGIPEPEHTTPYTVRDPSTSSPPVMTERKHKVVGFGFLNEPPPPSAWGSRRTGATTAEDRPISTASSKSTMYHDTRSRPESPNAYRPESPNRYRPEGSNRYRPESPDAYPDLTMSPRSEMLPDYDFSGDDDAHEIDVLDEPAPRSLRYPPGLTPTDARYLTISDDELEYDDLEEADIVPDVPITITEPHHDELDDVPITVTEPQYDELEDVPPQATTGWMTMHHGIPPVDTRRLTLGETLLLPPPAPGSPSASQFGSIGSHSSGRNGGESSAGSSNHSRNTRSSLSMEQHRIRDSISIDQELYALEDDDMPPSVSGRRLRGGPNNPLLSATFGSPSSWGRHGSRSASGSSHRSTPHSGRSFQSKDRSVSDSQRFGRSSSQQHLGQPATNSAEASPRVPGAMLSRSLAESGISLHRGPSANSLGEPSYLIVPTAELPETVRYVPSTGQLQEESDESGGESPLRPYRDPVTGYGRPF